LIGEKCDSVAEAFNLAREQAKKNDVVFVGGSTFVVAEVI
jgi:dihydrofolate synthase/folylpolyglutamate synthase